MAKQIELQHTDESCDPREMRIVEACLALASFSFSAYGYFYYSRAIPGAVRYAE